MPAFACSYGYSSGLTTATVHCAVNPPQATVALLGKCVYNKLYIFAKGGRAWSGRRAASPTR